MLFLGLDAQDAREDARDFISQFGLTFPHVRDPCNETARDWGVTGLPETFFIGADGRVVGHVIGTVDDGAAARRDRGRGAGPARRGSDGGDQRPGGVAALRADRQAPSSRRCGTRAGSPARRR